MGIDSHDAGRARLWDGGTAFEDRVARGGLELGEALALIDHGAWFDLARERPPEDLEGIGGAMLEEGMMARQDDGLWAVTNLGAALLARRLVDFPALSMKEARIVRYAGSNRMRMLSDFSCRRGLALGFQWMLDIIEAQIPTEEAITGALRVKRTAYPLEAVRELAANALVHQDFDASGARVVVEIFEGRIEISNPGTPLVDAARILDGPRRSRHPHLAGLVRRLLLGGGERGWRAAALACEKARVPAPRIDLYEDSVRVTLFAKTPFSSIPPRDRLWACRLHACLRQIQGRPMTTASLMARFGDTATISDVERLLEDAVGAELIRPLGPGGRDGFAPFWA